MKKYLVPSLIAGLTAGLALASVGCSAGDTKVSASTPAPTDAVKRGE